MPQRTDSFSRVATADLQGRAWNHNKEATIQFVGGQAGVNWKILTLKGFIPPVEVVLFDSTAIG